MSPVWILFFIVIVAITWASAALGAPIPPVEDEQGKDLRP
jgi:hypothetical protein